MFHENLKVWKLKYKKILYTTKEEKNCQVFHSFVNLPNS